MPPTYEDMHKLIVEHQTMCNRTIESNLGSISAILAQIAVKVDLLIKDVNDQKVSQRGLETRLAHGSDHFKAIDDEIKDIKGKMFRLILIMVASGSSGVLIAKAFIGGF